MWDILPGTLYHWYRDHLSDYHAEKATGAWPGDRLITADEETGEVLEEKPVYIFKPSNIGERMSIDDKAILYEIEQLKHCRYRLTQSGDKWSETGKELMDNVFEKHEELKTAYQISQNFKKWYDISNCQLDNFRRSYQCRGGRIKR